MEIDDQSNSPKSIMAFLKEIAATVSTAEKEPKEQLYLEIAEISQAGYCAGWAMDIEFFLWQLVLNGSETEFGVKTITAQEIARLKLLSEQSDGWWYWSNKENDALFITLDKWQEIYQRFLEKQSR